MKKVLSAFLIVLILLNFILCNGAYAAGGSPNTKQRNSAYTNTNSTKVSNGVLAELGEEGTTSTTQGSSSKTETSALSYGASIVGVVTGLLARLLNVFIALQVDLIMAQLTYGVEDNKLQYLFTIDRCVFNRVPLFNINYFNVEDEYKVGDTTIQASSSNNAIKQGIAGAYYISRVVAVSISVLVLIYIGIRMALSTVASEQARYKKMLVSWVESIVILFLMIYIISIVISLGEILTGIFYNIRCQLLGQTAGGTSGTYDVFEDTIRSKALLCMFEMSGLEVTLWSIIYWVLLFTEMKFLWTYMKRFLMVGFLIVISPLITISYSIDKAGDGKAQAFSTWLKEFMVNILIQPLHALIYLVFVLTANAIAASSPVIALAMLMAMGTVERMVKVVFDMRGLVSLRGVNKFLKKEG